MTSRLLTLAFVCVIVNEAMWQLQKADTVSSDEMIPALYEKSPANYDED